MLHTYLTTSWHLRYPIIGAPMAGIGRGRLARAVSEAGGLGMIGIGSTESVELIAREAAIARGTDQGRFGSRQSASRCCRQFIPRQISSRH